nr:peptidoglycan DD-metalloendopeptidase family protein [Spirochaetales bacterium]
AMYKEMQVQKLKTFEKKAALESTDSEKRLLARQTEKRLAAYYRMGDIGVLNITFSTSTLPELVNFHEYYRYMLRQDQQLIKRFRVKLKELQQAREAHIVEAKRLKVAMGDTKQQQIILAATKKEQQQIVAQIQIEKSLYQEAAKQLEQSAQALINDIEDLEKKAKQAQIEKEEWMIATYPIEPHKKRKPAWLRGIGGHQKQLTPPIMGTVTKLYTGDSSAPGDLNFGVDFKMAPQSKIRATFKGKVVHTGFVKGYGQLVIISHSDGYYTLTSSVNTITVKEGDTVQQGDEIGFATQHRANMLPDLHFEIRLREKPLDPLDWLDKNYIIFSPELEATMQKQ